jgi:lipopolysaccharide export system protein LptC
MNKLYYLLVLLVVLAIALVSHWLLTTVEQPPGRVPPEARHDPDYFMENFKITVYEANGSPAYHLKAAHMNHYPDDDTLALKDLRIEYRTEDNQSWITTAREGTAYENIEVMHLRGDVHIARQGQQPEQNLTLTTQTLRIDFPKKNASTDAEVKIVGKNSNIAAKGMIVNLETDHLTLLSEARGHYVPH